MYQLIGFIEYAPLIDNDLNAVATVGELSSLAQTYTRDKTHHHLSAHPDTTLVAFHSVRDDVSASVPDGVRDNVLSIGQYILDRAFAGALSSDSNVLKNLLLTEYSGIVQSVTVAQPVLYDSRYYPPYLTFEMLGQGEEVNVILYFSDSQFRGSYDQYEIQVIPPFNDLDQLFSDPGTIQTLVDTSSLTSRMSEVENIRGEYPFTDINALRYDYVNPSDTDVTVELNWIVIIYGKAGNNPDRIKEAIQAYVLENSTHTQSEWTPVLPSLFLSSEFVFIPNWQHYSIPNQELQAGFYSPIIRPFTYLEDFKVLVEGEGYTDQWLSENYEVFNNLYRSIAIGVVGNENNHTGNYQLSDEFSDLFLVSNDSPDVNRMTARTRQFAVILSELIHLAEDSNPLTTMPSGFSVTIRNGKRYVSTTYEELTLLVIERASMIESLTT